jgi:hypothetical protein
MKATLRTTIAVDEASRTSSLAADCKTVIPPI